jgi:hypothetical protein
VLGLPPGRYLLRALIDQNRNRDLDTRELYDTATVVLADSAAREMLAIARDTIGPGIDRIDRTDSLTLRIVFDRGLDSAQALTVANFTLKAQDSSVVPLASLIMGRAFERQRDDSIRRRVTEDSLRRVQQQDSTFRADSARAAAEGRPLPRRPTPRPVAPAPRPDSTRPEPPKPSRLAPETDVILRLTNALRPATNYRLRASDIRSFLGNVRTSERQFQTPRASADTARRDSTVRDTVRSR